MNIEKNFLASDTVSLHYITFSVEKSEDRSGPAGKFMVLDGITVKNLDILVNSSTGGSEGTLVGRLDSCSSAMGRR